MGRHGTAADAATAAAAAAAATTAATAAAATATTAAAAGERVRGGRVRGAGAAMPALSYAHRRANMGETPTDAQRSPL